MNRDLSVLMVCLGNICRSPMAQGVLERKLQDKGLSGTVDSAGTGGWHAGEAPDPRAIQMAKSKGIDISHQRARKFRIQDFEDFDYILVMDASNFQDIMHIAPHDKARQKVHMVMNMAHPNKNMPVPDPYYSGDFETSYRLLDEALEAFVEQVFTYKEV